MDEMTLNRISTSLDEAEKTRAITIALRTEDLRALLNEVAALERRIESGVDIMEDF